MDAILQHIKAFVMPVSGTDKMAKKETMGRTMKMVWAE